MNKRPPETKDRLKLVIKDEMLQALYLQDAEIRTFIDQVELTANMAMQQALDNRFRIENGTNQPTE